MMKSLALCAVLVTIAYAKPEYLIKGGKIEVTSHSIQVSELSLPVDDGTSNYGDLTMNPLTGGTVMLAHDVVMNEIRDEDQEITWQGHFPGYDIVNVRTYNVGRQRGIVHSASIDPATKIVQIKEIVRAGDQVRTVMEAFGVIQD